MLKNFHKQDLAEQKRRDMERKRILEEQRKIQLQENRRKAELEREMQAALQNLSAYHFSAKADIFWWLK